jgi:magnesium transporter
MLDQLTVERTSDVLDEMSSDDAADVLAELSHAEVDALLERMEPEAADDVAELLRYSDDIAGGLMAKEYVHVDPEQTVAETLALLRDHYADAEMIYDIYVIDEEERLLGVVTLRQLIIHAPDEVMSDIMAREYASVTTDMPQEDVADLVRRHDLLAVPVLDEEGRMQGIITVDDVGEVVQEEAAEDMLAVSGGEEVAETPLPWAARPAWRTGLVALAGGVLLAILVWVYARDLAAWQGAAALLPLLLVLAITASSQAALAMDHAYEHAVERHQLGRIFLREALAGAGLALIGGVLAGGLLLLRTQALVPARSAALALIFSLWTASLIGALGTVIVRKHREELGSLAHAAIVALALLTAVALDLWLARFGLPH